MKVRMKKVLPLVTVLATIGLTGSAQATEFWDMVAYRAAITTQGTNPNTLLNSFVSGSHITAIWNDTVGNGGVTGVFDGFDTLVGSLIIYNNSGAVVLTSPAGLTRPAFDAWAAANAPTIFNTLFPGGLSRLTGATDDNILASTTVSQNIFKKAEPIKKSQSNNAATAKNEIADANAEHQALKVNDYNGRSNSLVMGFSKAADSGLNYSLTIPYRATAVNDTIESRSRFLGVEMAAKYPVKKWDKDAWNLGGCAFGSAFTAETDTMDKSGNLKYGGGAFTSYDHDLGFGTIGVGLDYRLAKAYMPASMNSGGLFFDQTADYVNHHSPVQTISYGVNLGMPMAGDVAAVNLEVVRSNFISDDIPKEQRAKTSVNLGLSFYPSDTFELNLGVGRDFEMDKVDSMGLRLGVINRF